MKEDFRSHYIDILGHKCILPHEQDITIKYIDKGYFIQLRRIFRKLVMATPAHPQCKTFLKSASQIRLEQERHLKNYYYMIHPFSSLRIYWEVVMILAWMLYFFLLPITAEQIPVLAQKGLILQIICTTHVVLSFFTGYVAKYHQEIILQPSKVLENYLKSYFTADVVIILLCSEYIWSQEFSSFLMFIPLFRVKTWGLYVKNLYARLDVKNYRLRSFNLGIYLFIFIWVFTSIYTAVNYKKENDLIKILFTFSVNCHKIVTMMFIPRFIEDESDPIFHVILLLGSTFVMLVVYAELIQIYIGKSNTSDENRKLKQTVQEYMKYIDIPSQLKQRIITYADFKLQKRIYKEDIILNSLSNRLRQDILFENSKHLIEKFHIFAGIPKPIILQIVNKLKSEIYLTGDMIVKANRLGHSMYFISSGLVAVYTASGREICHLEEGDHFGEIALFLNEPRLATVVAVQNSELYRLSQREFSKLTAEYPDVGNLMKERCIKHLDETLEAQPFIL